jgi:hypothetical protein
MDRADEGIHADIDSTFLHTPDGKRIFAGIIHACNSLFIGKEISSNY